MTVENLLYWHHHSPGDPRPPDKPGQRMCVIKPRIVSDATLLLDLSIDMIGCKGVTLAWEHFRCKPPHHANWQQSRLQLGRQLKAVFPYYKEVPRVFRSRTPGFGLK